MRSIFRSHKLRKFFVLVTLTMFWISLKQNKQNFAYFKRQLYTDTIIILLNVSHQNISPQIISKPEISSYSQRSHYFVPDSLKKIDWHNYTQISYERSRVGTSDQGSASNLTKASLSIIDRLFAKNGFNVVLSKKIPFNRSLPDTRRPECKNRLYLESLPTVSIIVPFYNEHWSTLLRTVYSVLYRSPKHLIKEFFLCDDGSTIEFLKRKLDIYLKKHFPKVKVLRLANHTGLVAARLLGAKAATADVLVFLDSHVEANVNWLPPLLEPIALNYRVVLCPHIDRIDYETFKYIGNGDDVRGAFDWKLNYINMPVLPNDMDNMPDPFESPVMIGGLFAISRVFFWELGGYDTGLLLSGSEQIEISFKNKRRVADVWMDEYVKYLYARIPELRDIDPGDLTEQKALRKRLKCKPFRWFMNQVAFDLPYYHPMIENPPFASGRIRPMSKPDVCVTVKGDVDEHLVLMPCKTTEKQFFVLSGHRDVRVKEVILCWDVPTLKSPVLLFACHNSGGNQLWRYHEVNKTLIHSQSRRCLDYDPYSLQLYINMCFVDTMFSETQKWLIDNINTENTVKWEDIKLRTGPVEEWKDYKQR